MDLSSYKSIGSNLFVRIDVQDYWDGSAFTPTILRFSDRRTTETINGEDYLGIGNLMSISTTSSELRVSGNELTITVSGIPNSSIAEIVQSRIKGSPVSVYRKLYNATTDVALNITGNPLGRFFGYVNNYSLSEEYDIETRTSSNTIALICTSMVDVLSNKVAGRATNQESEKTFFPNDLSMDRVTALEGMTFNFGAPSA